MVDSFNLSLRADSISGELSRSVNLEGDLPLDNRNILLLIHGYNNDRSQAEKSFKKFTNNLFQPSYNTKPLITVCNVFWPGNLSNKILSSLSYPFQVLKAKQCAIMLGDYLADIVKQKPGTNFIFVGHSLGCRIVLEIINYIYHKYPLLNTNFSMTTLMAAAVPSFMVNDITGRLYPVRMHDQPFLGFYSENDSTLRNYFPTGQTVIGEGVFPEALGYKGNPSSFWTKGKTNTGLKHGDYWGNVKVNQEIGINIGTTNIRGLTVKNLVVRDLVR